MPATSENASNDHGRLQPPHVHIGTGCFSLLILIAAIVLASMWFVARTHHFRRALAEELRARTGLIVKFEHTAMAFPYDLVARGVVATGDWAIGGAVTLNAVRLALRPGGPLVLRCEGGEVRFVRHAEAGVWDPEPLAGWAAMQAPSEAAELLDNFPRWLRVEAREMRVSWRDEQGVEWRTWSNATLRLIPVSLPNRPGWVIEGSVEHAIDGGRTGIECRLEWLACRGRPFLKLSESGIWNGLVPPGTVVPSGATGAVFVAASTNRPSAP